MQQKHDIAANWKNSDFIPEAGEYIIYDPDEYTNFPRIKIGDGIHTVNELFFVSEIYTQSSEPQDAEDGAIWINPDELSEDNKNESEDENNNSQAISSSIYGKRILAIGDSFVAGHTLSQSQTWVYKLATRNNMTYSVKATNGISLTGQNSQTIAKQINSITSNFSNADFVCVLGGHNDANAELNGGSPVPIGTNEDTGYNTYKGGLKYIIEALLKAYPRAHILFLTPFNRRGIEEPYVDAMKEICGIYCIPCFDNYHNGNMSFQNPYQKQVYELGTTLHYNEAGQERLSFLYESILNNQSAINYSAPQAEAKEVQEIDTSIFATKTSVPFSFVAIEKEAFDNLATKQSGTIYFVKNYGVYLGTTCIISTDNENAGGGEIEEEVVLVGITVSYSGGNVAVGTDLNSLEGIEVLAHYSDGSAQAVEGYTLSGTIEQGSNTITVSYAGKTANFIVDGEDNTGILISDLTKFALGSAYIANGAYVTNTEQNRLSANIEEIEFYEGDTITIGDYSKYKFALSTTPTSGQTKWLDGGYQTANRTLTAEEAADMRIMMVARLDNANFTDADIAFINANAKILR